ncbi:hypothetical protein JYT98_00925 [bacterium AH-315-K05]|jgi:hypothetical protein|nr:hypothetical protein [bacterium AH-315-K05]
MVTKVKSGAGILGIMLLQLQKTTNLAMVMLLSGREKSNSHARKSILNSKS